MVKSEAQVGCSPPAIPVHQEGGKWKTSVVCPAGCPAGTPVDTLLSTCLECEQNPRREIHKQMDAVWNAKVEQAESTYWEDKAKAEQEKEECLSSFSSTVTVPDVKQAPVERQVIVVETPKMEEKAAIDPQLDEWWETHQDEYDPDEYLESRGEVGFVVEDKKEEGYSAPAPQMMPGANPGAKTSAKNKTELKKVDVLYESVPTPEETSIVEANEATERKLNDDERAGLDAIQNSIGRVIKGVETIDESRIDLDKILEGIGVPGGSSTGGLSSHTLADFTCPRKIYLGRVLGIEPKVRPIYFNQGTLLHACMAMRYAKGRSQQYKPIEAAIQAGAVEIAAAVRHWVDHVEKYGTEEETLYWCPLMVEENVIFWLPPVRIGGKLVRIPVSMRYDLVVAMKLAEQPCPGPGGAKQYPIYVADHKTASQMTSDLIYGYGIDPQFLTYGTGYIESGLEDELGPLSGFLVQIIQKHPKKMSKGNLYRGRIPLPKSELADFYRGELIPSAVALYEKLASPERDNPDTWPKCRKMCIGRYGRCEFFKICDIGGSMNSFDYTENSDRIIKIEDLQEPPKGLGGSRLLGEYKGPNKEVTHAKPNKSEEKITLQDQFLVAFSNNMFNIMQNTEKYQGYEVFAMKNFLVPGHTLKSVTTSLTKTMKEFYGPAASNKDWNFKMNVPAFQDPISVFATKTGFKPIHGGVKGAVSFKKIAEAVSHKVFDVTQSDLVDA